LEAEEGFREETESREEERLSGEAIQQQVVNQGIDTGTHSYTHFGVDWRPEFRVRPDLEQASPTREQIEARAYELYLQRGGEHGHDVEDWLIAENELKQQ
jgi:hypothetical protein